MKAYKAGDAKNEYRGSTVVFAETAQAAKVIAMSTDACEDTPYIDIRVTRFPEMDSHHRGRSGIDWYDPEDRKALVALGWSCYETSWECDTCAEKESCTHWGGQEEAEE